MLKWWDFPEKVMQESWMLQWKAAPRQRTERLFVASLWKLDTAIWHFLLAILGGSSSADSNHLQRREKKKSALTSCKCMSWEKQNQSCERYCPASEGRSLSECARRFDLSSQRDVKMWRWKRQNLSIRWELLMENKTAPQHCVSLCVRGLV